MGREDTTMGGSGRVVEEAEVISDLDGGREFFSREMGWVVWEIGRAHV